MTDMGKEVTHKKATDVLVPILSGTTNNEVSQQQRRALYRRSYQSSFDSQMHSSSEGGGDVINRHGVSGMSSEGMDHLSRQQGTGLQPTPQQLNPGDYTMEVAIVPTSGAAVRGGGKGRSGGYPLVLHPEPRHRALVHHHRPSPSEPPPTTKNVHPSQVISTGASNALRPSVSANSISSSSRPSRRRRKKITIFGHDTADPNVLRMTLSWKIRRKRNRHHHHNAQHSSLHTHSQSMPASQLSSTARMQSHPKDARGHTPLTRLRVSSDDSGAQDTSGGGGGGPTRATRPSESGTIPESPTSIEAGEKGGDLASPLTKSFGGADMGKTTSTSGIGHDGSKQNATVAASSEGEKEEPSSMKCTCSPIHF